MNASPSPEPERQPHAVLDLASRRLKARKIERLLELSARPQPMRLLEIGTGSGGIAHYFATHPNLHIEVDAVDVVDNRLVSGEYAFQMVKDTHLPFADRSFDIVLTNHVIEHVGDTHAQLGHLREIRRVLREDGIGYLAVPNRWRLVEPHYRLAFLSCWPRRWRSPYLKWRRGVEFYDCEPLQPHEVERLFSQADLRCRNLCAESLRATLDIERPGSLASMAAARAPDWLLGLLRRAVTTLIYRFWR